MKSIMALGASLFFAVSLAAQTQAPAINSSSTTAKDSKPAKAVKKPPLSALTLMSTDELARKAADEAAKKSKAQTQGAKPASASKPAPANTGGVMEFQPAAASSQPGSGTFQTKDGKKSALKHVHGEAYGDSAGAIGNREGAEAGAASSNGKLNVYVGAEHSQANSPNSH